ncbi:MAG: POTRA domain-containing protein [Thermoguttaceae bacterium]
MAGVRFDPGTAAGRVWLTLYVVLAILGGSLVYSGGIPEKAPPPLIVDLRIRGNNLVPDQKIIPQIHSRTGRPFDPRMIDEDIRRLYQTRKFVKVSTIIEDVPGGKRVIFDILEKPIFQYVKFVGNEDVSKKTLAKEAGLKAGEPMDPYAVEEGRRKLIEYYHSKGFSKVYIEIAQGNRANDPGAIFVIDEGPKQRVLWTHFVGNTIASGERLVTQVKTKPGWFWYIKGDLDRKELEEDIKRLTSYYHDLGFFDVTVGAILEPSEEQNWVTVTFVINEGLRYQVRNVRLVGNKKFGTAELTRDFKLRPGKTYIKAEHLFDKAAMQDIYGSEGYVFTKIDPQIRFLENQPGLVDLVYGIKESPQVAAGKINVEIKGETPHTKTSVVRDRMSIYPGQIVDSRELRASERRFKASQIFLNDPTKGATPKIVIAPPPGFEGDDTVIAEKPQKPGGFRGQSPDPEPYETRRPVQASDLGSEEEVRELVNPLDPAAGYPEAQPACEPSDTAPASAETEPEILFRGQAPDDAPSAGGAGQQAPQTAQPPAQKPGLDVNGGWSPATAGRGPSATATPQSSPAASPSSSNAGLHWRSPESLPGESPRYGGSPAGAAVGQGSATGSYQGGNYPASNYPANNHPAEDDRRRQDAFDAPSSGNSLRSPVPLMAAAPGSFAPSGVNTHDPNGGTTLPTMGYQPLAPMGPARPADDFGGPLQTAQAGNGYPGTPGLAPQGSVVSPTDPSVVPPGSGPPLQGAYVPRGDMARPTAEAPPGGYASPGPAVGQPSLLGGKPNEDPMLLPLTPELEEAQTGRFMFSVGVNSELGLVGSIVIDEQNFDILRLPTSWDDVINGRAWRGDGERFRLELSPGVEVSRYSVTWSDPYLFHTENTLSLSGSYYDQYFDDWSEIRAGGRVMVGRQLGTPDLTGSLSFRGEAVHLGPPYLDAPDIVAALGNHQIFGLRAALALDKRDNPFLATEGYFAQMGFEQVEGSYSYPRADFEFRKFFLLHQRPDQSGRQVLSLTTRFLVTGDNTPVYDRFFAGGFSTLRGFAYRGAAPVQLAPANYPMQPEAENAFVGGDCMLLASAEYLFPITADDMLRGVVFCDTGTVVPTISQWNQSYRVAPGFGLRITIPMMGPAPIALDFAFPINSQSTDYTQVFSFFVGFMR